MELCNRESCGNLIEFVDRCKMYWWARKGAPPTTTTQTTTWERCSAWMRFSIQFKLNARENKIKPIYFDEMLHCIACNWRAVFASQPNRIVSLCLLQHARKLYMSNLMTKKIERKTEIEINVWNCCCVSVLSDRQMPSLFPPPTPCKPHSWSGFSCFCTFTKTIHNYIIYWFRKFVRIFREIWTVSFFSFDNSLCKGTKNGPREERWFII